MKLITAHRVLIGAAMLLFVFYGLRDAGTALGGDGLAFFESAFYFAAAIGLAIYLRWINARNRQRRVHLP